MFLSFFKKHSSMILKLVIHQLGLMVFGIAVTTGAMSFGADKGEETEILYMVLASAFSVLFYLALLLFATNEEGIRDKIRIDAGRMQRDPLLGGKWALAANCLNILFALILVVFYFFDSAFTNTVYDVCLLLAALIQSPFMGLRAAYLPNNPIAFVLMPLFPVAVCALGYYLGIRGVMILPAKKKKQ